MPAKDKSAKGKKAKTSQKVRAEKKEKKGAQKEFLESAHQVWLAGLGAMAVAEEEGSKLFRKLVEQGERFESQSRERIGEVKEKAEEGWQRLSGTFDSQVAKTLGRLGVPSRDDVRDLNAKVEELTKKLEELKSGAGKP